MMGVFASLILITLAAVMPQIPRQRAITLVQSRGGSLSWDTTYPPWAYSLIGEERILRFEHVSEINLDGTDVDDAVIARLIELKEARLVWLNSANITDRGALLLRNFLSISSLDLGNTNLTERSLVPVMKHHQNLQTVWLQGTEAGDETLRALSGATSLQNLYVADTYITDAGLVHLSGLPRLSNVIMSGTNIGDAGVAHLGTCPSLSDLDLARTQIEGPGLEPLARLPALHSLNLNGTPLGNEGARHLGASTSLMSLMLDGTNLTDAGLEHLANIKTLSTLSLNGVEITDEGLEHLQQATGLSELYIDSRQVTPEGISDLRHALPGCSVNGGGVLPGIPGGGGFSTGGSGFF